jgi:hypothetical protein
MLIGELPPVTLSLQKQVMGIVNEAVVLPVVSRSRVFKLNQPKMHN